MERTMEVVEGCKMKCKGGREEGDVSKEGEGEEEGGGRGEGGGGGGHLDEIG